MARANSCWASVFSTEKWQVEITPLHNVVFSLLARDKTFEHYRIIKCYKVLSSFGKDEMIVSDYYTKLKFQSFRKFEDYKITRGKIWIYNYTMSNLKGSKHASPYTA